MKWYDLAKKIIRQKKIKRKDLLKPLELKALSGVEHKLRGLRGISVDQFAALCQVLGVEMQALYYCDEFKINEPAAPYTNEREKKLIEAFRIMTPSQQSEMLAKADEALTAFFEVVKIAKQQNLL